MPASPPEPSKPASFTPFFHISTHTIHLPSVQIPTTITASNLDLAKTLFFSPSQLQKVVSISPLCREFSHPQPDKVTYPVVIPSELVKKWLAPPGDGNTASSKVTPTSFRDLEEPGAESKVGDSVADETGTQTLFKFFENVSMFAGIVKRRMEINGTWTVIESLPPTIATDEHHNPSLPVGIYETHARETTSGEVVVKIWKMRELLYDLPTEGGLGGNSSPTSVEIKVKETLWGTCRDESGGTGGGGGLKGKVMKWFVGREGRRAHVEHMEGYAGLWEKWVEEQGEVGGQ